MAEVAASSSSPLKNNHVNEMADMEAATISTPLQQELKRKRQHINKTITIDTPSRKKPRKKKYKPKVIGEGKRKKGIVLKAPAIPNKPKKPNKSKKLKTLKAQKAPKLVVSSTSISGCQENILEKTNNLLQEDNTVVFETENALPQVKELQEEVVHNTTTTTTTLDLTKSLGGWFCGLSSNTPPEYERKRSSRTQASREEANGLQPFFFYKRKRTPMVRKCNLASLIAHCKWLQLLRNAHKPDSVSQNAIITNGNHILPTIGWLLKKPNQFRNRKRSPCTSKFNYNVRDEFDFQTPSASKSNDKNAYARANITDDTSNEFDKDEFDYKVPSVSKSNDKDASAGTASTDDISDDFPAWKSNDKDTSTGTATKDANKRLSPPNSKFSDIRNEEGTVWKIGDAIHTEKLCHNSKSTMRWLDIRHYLTKSRLLNGSGEKIPQEESLSLPRIKTGSANETRSALDVILWNRSEAARNNNEHFGLSGNPYCEKVLVPYHVDGGYEKVQNGETSSSKVKQVIPYEHERGKKTREHIQSYVHGMEGAIVPHTTKKKVSGKVDLDPRDIVVWKLLNQDHSNISREEADIHDEKRWANEREIFRVRIDAFNARMSGILGDRRFSPWKGSVVDSVVGVFLTQNVSDHLSSSAYMSLAAAFPLQAKRNHTDNYQQLTLRNNGYYPYESKWTNDSMSEGKKTTEDPEEVEELMSESVATLPQDLLESFIKSSLDETLLSPTCIEDGCGTCLCTNLDSADNTVLHSNKSTFAQEHYSSSQTSTPMFGGNQENNILESKDVGWRNQNPSGTLHMVNYLCSECKSKPMSGLKNKDEESNPIEEMKEFDLQFTGDVNAKCCLCSDIQTSNGGIKKTTEFYNYYHEKMEPCFQLLPVESVKSKESVIQGAQNLKDIDGNDLNHEKKTVVLEGKAKKKKMKQEIDWNSLREKWDTMRRSYYSNEPRSSDHMDSVDWEAVRSANPLKIADAIKERGQHNIIAGRIKDFLNRTVRIHGHLDLEWLKHAPPNDVKEYLLGIDGIGLKSAECVRLLSLQQVAFPVDVNVGRIAVRIGWVPLEPLPDEVQMHLLETFPMMDSIQKYLWPRLSTLDPRTLYELHYQMITFGKVFCTKIAPNCNACPLKAECRHYASAYANAKLKLPGLDEKNMASTMVPENRFEGIAQEMNPMSITHIPGYQCSGSSYQTNKSEPIIEVPQSPKNAYDESQWTDIEEFFEYDSDDVPVIRLTYEQSTTTSQNGMDDDNTRALIPLHTNVDSFPISKLKDEEYRLGTKHDAYELPDNHPLLHELGKREPNDPCPYLLIISLLSTGCRGTILIPCRTAMRGKFPLNGTYFQVNEVFADDETSRNPIHVPREWIWDLPRRTAYFGTSTATILRGKSIEYIQNCFQNGFICVRGFNRKTRTPKRLVRTLHMRTQASVKARENKNMAHPTKPNSPSKP